MKPPQPIRDNTSTSREQRRRGESPEVDQNALRCLFLLAAYEVHEKQCIIQQVELLELALGVLFPFMLQ